MVAETVVFLLVEAERLLLVALLHARHQFVVLPVVRIHAVDGKEILLVADVLLVGGTKKTLAERKVVDGIEDVGLSRPVEAHETVDILRQLQIGRFTVLEVRQFEFVEVHLLMTSGHSTSSGTRGR